MRPDDPLLLAELRRDEGVRRWPYADTLGIKTVGVGHNLVAHPLSLIYPLDDAEIDVILIGDIAEVIAGLDARLPWWRSLNDVRQRVIVNMAFNMGIAGLLTFKNTLAAVRGGRYSDAAAGMLASKWAKQVGARAKRLADMMREG